MAAISLTASVRVKSPTLSTTVADAITIAAGLGQVARVYNHTAATTLWVTRPQTPAPSAITAAADNAIPVIPGTFRDLPVVGGEAMFMSIVGSSNVYTIEMLSAPIHN